jgi:TonB family protein
LIFLEEDRHLDLYQGWNCIGLQGMKVYIFLLLVVVFGLQGFTHAQSKKKLYYSNHWEITTQDSAHYYRICSLDTLNYRFNGDVEDYLINNQLVFKGSYINGQKKGEFISYYPNGQIESQGEFKENKRFGFWKYYFPNGKTWREVTFNEDTFFVNSAFDSSGNIQINNGTGEWVYDYEWPGLPYRIVVKGLFTDGKKEGKWNCSTSTGDLLYRENFTKDKFKKGTRFQNGQSAEYADEFQNKFMLPYKFQNTEEFMYQNFVRRVDYPFLNFLPSALKQVMNDIDTDMVFTVVEQPAQYPGGFEALAGHLGRNLQYPPNARRQGIQGTVFVSFVVNKDGSISDISLVKGIGGGCDEEAIRVVSKFPEWIPGMQNGKKVNSRFVLPIKFKLAR